MEKSTRRYAITSPRVSERVQSIKRQHDGPCSQKGRTFHGCRSAPIRTQPAASTGYVRHPATAGRRGGHRPNQRAAHTHATDTRRRRGGGRLAGQTGMTKQLSNCAPAHRRAALPLSHASICFRQNKRALGSGPRRTERPVRRASAGVPARGAGAGRGPGVRWRVKRPAAFVGDGFIISMPGRRDARLGARRLGTAAVAQTSGAGPTSDADGAEESRMGREEACPALTPLPPSHRDGCGNGRLGQSGPSSL